MGRPVLVQLWFGRIRTCRSLGSVVISRYSSTVLDRQMTRRDFSRHWGNHLEKETIRRRALGSKTYAT